MNKSLDDIYRAEGWGAFAETALGIPPSLVESQARDVARFCVRLVEELKAAQSKREQDLLEANNRYQEDARRAGREAARLREERDRANRNRDMWQGQCDRQAVQLENIRRMQNVTCVLIDPLSSFIADGEDRSGESY